VPPWSLKQLLRRARRARLTKAKVSSKALDRVAEGPQDTDSELGALTHEFEAAKDKVIFVSYTGAVPDTFREPRPNEPAPEVVVTGDLLQQNKFAAVDLLAKCPSKYEAKAKAEAATGTTEQSGTVTPATTP
jgi:cytochrome c-type biogenesis protein CcmE